MKKTVIILIVLAGLGAGLWWWTRGAGKAAETGAPIKTARVTRGDIEVHIEATGSVESNLDVDIKCKASGEVLALPRDVSDHVPKHEPGANDEQALLVALDPIDESRRVQRARAARDAAAATVVQAEQVLAIARERLRVAGLEADASIAAAVAQADLDKLLLKRQQDLAKTDASTQHELDVAAATARISQAQLSTARALREALAGVGLAVEQRKAEVALARARLAGAEADLDDAQQRLAETKVYAPIAGVITRRDVQIGQIIASGIVNIAGGTTLLTVSDMSRVFVEADVDESDVGRLVETGKLAQTVSITADAYPSRKFTGKVVQLTPRGRTEANVVTFTVKIEVVGEGRQLLLPKMTANVKILANRKTDVLLVPTGALHYEKDEPYVYVRRGGEFERQPVQLGLMDADNAEVVDGLDKGEAVAVGTDAVTRWSKTSRSATQPAPKPPGRGNEE